MSAFRKIATLQIVLICFVSMAGCSGKSDETTMNRKKKTTSTTTIESSVTEETPEYSETKATAESEETEETTEVFQSLNNSSENHPHIDGFEFADYYKYASFENEEEFYDSSIYFDGVIGDYVCESLDPSVQNVKTIILSVRQEDGNEWLLWFYDEPITSPETLKNMVGKKVRVFGLYDGISRTKSKPMVDIYSESCCIEDFDEGIRYDCMSYTNNCSTIQSWCDRNNREILVDEIAKSENEMMLCKSVGIVESIESKTRKICIYTKKKDNSFVKYTFETDPPAFFCDKNLLDSIKVGDSVSIYYEVYPNEVCLVFGIEKTSNIGYTQKDIDKQFNPPATPTPSPTPKPTQTPTPTPAPTPKPRKHRFEYAYSMYNSGTDTTVFWLFDTDNKEFVMALSTSSCFEYGYYKGSFKSGKTVTISFYYDGEPIEGDPWRCKNHGSYIEIADDIVTVKYYKCDVSEADFLLGDYAFDK